MGTFSHDVRVLVCGKCGAPLTVANEGGDTRCDYCQATTRVNPRQELPVAAADRQPISEDERLRILRTQDGKPLRSPESLPLALIGWQGDPHPKKYALCLEVWKLSRDRIQSGKPEEHDEQHIFFLTMVLSNYYGRTKELNKLRAALEHAIELCKEPRNRQVLLCMMARQAAKAGDVDDAEVWLAPCDASSVDLQMDSAWRYTQAYLATRRANYMDVVEVLGMRTGDIPIVDFYEHSAAVLRANAHERVGDHKMAREVLEKALEEVRSSPRIIKHIVEHNPELELCPKTWPVVYGPRMLRWRLRWWLYTLVWMGAMIYFIASWVGGEKGDGWSFGVRNIGPAIGTLVLGFIPWIRWRP